MLAVPWPAAFSDADWGFELKWDGVRALAYSDGARLGLRSRNGNDLTGRCPGLASLSVDPCVIDGEVVAVDDDGRPSFDRLARAGQQDVPVHFVAFDILELAGRPLLDRSLATRRELLLEVAGPTPITVNDLTPSDGLALYSVIKEAGLEGMVAKRLDSRYEGGRRSGNWRKILNLRSVRCVVGGYTESDAGEAFSALLLGLFDGPKLRFVGRVGSGFTNQDKRAIRSALDDMTGSDPFIADDEIPAATYVAPELVAHVEFRSWTLAGRLRGPVFKGFGIEDVESVTWGTEGPGNAG